MRGKTFDAMHRAAAIKYYYQRAHSLRKTADIFGIGKSTLSRWLHPLHMARNTRKRKRDTLIARISEMMRANPFTTLSRIKQTLVTDDIRISTTTAWRVIRDTGYSRKRTRHRSSKRTATLEESERFGRIFCADGEKVSIDETCIYLHDSPRYGYAPRGEPVYHHTQRPPRSDKVSLLLAISDKRGIIAHRCIKGAFNKQSFTEFLSNIDVARGTPLILDNVAFHHSLVVRRVAAERGLVLLFTPPYSPDFNPIESAFSTLKNAMRQNDPVKLEEAMKSITTSKCSGFFRGTRNFVQRYIEKLRNAAESARATAT